MTKTNIINYITHEEDDQLIYMRSTDGYINATAMCKKFGKRLNDYSRLDTTKEFVQELSSDAGIPADLLIVKIMTGENEIRGTWIHPDLAVNLAMWLSPKFSVKVSRLIKDWISGKNLPTEKFIPHHLKRYYLNEDRIPKGYFSVLQEMTIMVFGKFEILGYLIPSNIVPDISEGRLFAKWMRDQGVDTDNLPTYNHRYEDGRVFPAKLYPNEHLVAFKSHVENIWLPEKAHKYFKERDVEALPFLEKALQISEALSLKTIGNA